MEYDTERTKEKTEELVNIVEEAIDKYWRLEGYNASPEEMLNAAKQIVDNFIQITPPEKAKDISFDYVLMSPGGRGGGRSIKPGNIFLNIRKLITSLAASALTAIGAVTVPWTVPLAAIVIWNNLRSNLQIELSEREAAIIWTMWMNRDNDNCVPNTELLNLVNSELKQHGRNSTSHQELDDSLEILEKMQCIERSKRDSSKWWLRDWVRITYR